MGQGVLLCKDLPTCVHACNSKGVPSARKHSLAPPGSQLPGATVLCVCVYKCACVYARAHVQGAGTRAHRWHVLTQCYVYTRSVFMHVCRAGERKVTGAGAWPTSRRSAAHKCLCPMVGRCKEGPQLLPSVPVLGSAILPCRDFLLGPGIASTYILPKMQIPQREHIQLH